MNMLLSIIIPSYNTTKELLTRCLARIVRQEIPQEEHEIIIVDDGSAKPPTWVKDVYGYNNLKLITATHGGPGAARNRGMEEAIGEYIMFVDADDYLMTNGELAKCLDYLKTEKPQILRFRQVASIHDRYPRPKRKIKFSKAITGAEFMATNNLPGSPCTYFFLREPAINKSIKFPTNIFHEDEEFNTILHYHSSSLVECDASLYYYCMREGSTTTNTSGAFIEKRLENMFRIIARINQFKEAFNINASETQKAGIERKLAMLAVDAIINMIYMGKSDEEIIALCSEHLSKIRLHPLPKLPISFKYKMFRRFSCSTRGMSIIRRFVLKNSSPKK